MAAFVYGVAEPQAGYGSDVAGVLGLVGLVVLHVATGFGTARWWAVLLPAVAVLVAIPAGYPDGYRGEPLPIWFGLAAFSPVGALLIAAGVGTALTVSRRRRPGRTSR